MVGMNFDELADAEDKMIAEQVNKTAPASPRLSRRQRREAKNANKIRTSPAELLKKEQSISDASFGHETLAATPQQEEMAKFILGCLTNRFSWCFKKESVVSCYNTILTPGKANGERQCSCCGTPVPRTVATCFERTSEGKKIIDPQTGLFRELLKKITVKGKEVNQLVPGTNGNYFATCAGPKGKGCGKGLVFTRYTVTTSEGKQYTFDTECDGSGHAQILDEMFSLGLVMMCPYDTQHPYFPGPTIEPKTHTLGSFLKKNFSEFLKEDKKKRWEARQEAEKKEDDGFTPVKTRPVKKKGQKMTCVSPNCNFTCWTFYQGNSFKCNRCRGVKK